MEFRALQVVGSGAPITELVVPYQGKQLKGQELEGQCAARCEVFRR